MLGYYLAIIALMAVTNRFWGMGVVEDSFIGKNHRKLSAALIGAVGGIMWHITGHWEIIYLTIGFFLMRSLGYKVFNGSLTPRTQTETMGSFLRFFIPVVAFVGVYSIVMSPDNILILLFMTFVTAILATFTSVMYAYSLDDGPGFDTNIISELIHGGLYGFLFVSIIHVT
jgi:hypothetical protein